MTFVRKECEDDKRGLWGGKIMVLVAQLVKHSSWLQKVAGLIPDHVTSCAYCVSQVL